MQINSDVVIIGTGLASLVAATYSLAEGYSVVILNPDWDYFEEDSELPLDPLWPAEPQILTPSRLKKSRPENVLDVLTPPFPGSIEFWQSSQDSNANDNFYQKDAPHIRSRSRLWLKPNLLRADPRWQALEEFYVEASDAGFRPIFFEDLMAARRFPGYAIREQASENLDSEAILLPKLCDVDVSRYRNGVMEFVRERLEPDRMFRGVSQITLGKDSIQFYYGGEFHQVTPERWAFAFWTPRMTQIMRNLADFSKSGAKEPSRIRIWEDWTLVSRDALNPEIIGVMEDFTVWPEIEGAPEEGNSTHLLKLLKPTAALTLDEWNTLGFGSHWASEESFKNLSKLCLNFMGWDHYSIRSMKPRALFEWDESSKIQILDKNGNYSFGIVPFSDGPIFRVVESARKAFRLMEKV